MGIASKERCGRINVVLDDGRVVTADYRATPHRLEIRVGDWQMVTGATSWCDAIRWGYEFTTGRETQRVAVEVKRNFPC